MSDSLNNSAIKIGTRFKNLHPEIDDDDGVERITPPGSIAEVISIDDYPGQGLTYGFGFPETGGSGYLLLSEILDPAQYEIIS